MPEEEPLTRDQLAGNIRAYALRLYWFNQKSGRTGSLGQALEEAGKLLVAVTAYEQLLIELGQRPLGEENNDA
jgi:hypothetical protein